MKCGCLAVLHPPLLPVHLAHSRHLFVYLRARFSINVTLGPKEDRVLTTGLHTVCDIFCTTCEENIGTTHEIQPPRRA